MDNSKIAKLALKNDKRVSHVKFITDDKLKDFIKEVQTMFNDELEETISLGMEHQCERILEIQYMIRKYIIENQTRINFSQAVTLKEGSPLSMTSLFGLYLMVVADINPVKTVVDVLRQIEHEYFTSLGEKTNEEDACGLLSVPAVIYADTINEKLRCCCSHKCHKDHMGIIRNMITNYHVVIGCDCIKKNHLIDKNVIRAEREKTVKFINNKAKKLEERIQRKNVLIELERQLAEHAKREIEGIERAKQEQEGIERAKREEQDKKKRDEEYAIMIEKHDIMNERLAHVKKIRIGTDERFYIDVKYHEKEEAKKLGAWWDNDERKWFIHSKSYNIYSLLEKYYKH